MYHIIFVVNISRSNQTYGGHLKKNTAIRFKIQSGEIVYFFKLGL